MHLKHLLTWKCNETAQKGNETGRRTHSWQLKVSDKTWLLLPSKSLSVTRPSMDAVNTSSLFQGQNFTACIEPPAPIWQPQRKYILGLNQHHYNFVCSAQRFQKNWREKTKRTVFILSYLVWPPPPPPPVSFSVAHVGFGGITLMYSAHF